MPRAGSVSRCNGAASRSLPTFKVWNADIDFDPADLTHAKASVTIDLGSEVSGISRQ